jgi:hypothetical protein
VSLAGRIHVSPVPAPARVSAARAAAVAVCGVSVPGFQLTTFAGHPGQVSTLGDRRVRRAVGEHQDDPSPPSGFSAPFPAPCASFQFETFIGCQTLGQSAPERITIDSVGTVQWCLFAGWLE